MKQLNRAAMRVRPGAAVMTTATAILTATLTALTCAPVQAQSVPAMAVSQVPPCSWTPNCVSSNGKPGESKYIAPLKPPAGEKEPMKRLKEVVSAMPGAKLVVEQPFILKYEFTTPKMKFVDDVQFSLVPASGIIEMRSASRLGISDFGVNRQRMDAVRAAYEKR